MFSALCRLLRLFFPPECPVCGGAMADGETVMCTACRLGMPLTYMWREMDNFMARRLWGRFPFIHASAFLFFRKGSGYQGMVHRIKYYGDKRLGYHLGLWYGQMMADGSAYSAVDMVIPVPLHPSKMRKRGYNQSEYIARGIAESIGSRVETRALVRSRRTETQAQKQFLERNHNVDGAFEVVRPELLVGKSVIIVDDVMTTGATIEASALAIVRAVPDCRISVCALAVVE